MYVVDRVPERLAKVCCSPSYSWTKITHFQAKSIGCVPIDLSAGNPAEQIKSLRGGREVDRGVDGKSFSCSKCRTWTSLMPSMC